MNKIKRFAETKPVLFSTMVLITSILLTEIPLASVMAPYFGKQIAHYLGMILKQGLVGLALFGLLARFGWKRLAGFTKRTEWKQIWLGWPMLLYCLLNTVNFLDMGIGIDFTQPVRIVLLVLANLSTGWFEETMGRGVMLVSMLKKWGQTRLGIIKAVLVSGVLFSLGHIINMLMGRYPLTNNIAQLAYSLFSAIIFAACVLRNRAIWPVMVLHALFNLASHLNEIVIGGTLQPAVTVIGTSETLITILLTLPLGLYGLFLLRKVEPISNEVNKE